MWKTEGKQRAPGVFHIRDEYAARCASGSAELACGCVGVATVRTQVRRVLEKAGVDDLRGLARAAALAGMAAPRR